MKKLLNKQKEKLEQLSKLELNVDKKIFDSFYKKTVLRNWLWKICTFFLIASIVITIAIIALITQKLWQS